MRQSPFIVFFVLAAIVLSSARPDAATAADLYRSVFSGSANTLANANGWSTTAIATGAAPATIATTDRLIFSNYWTPGLAGAAPSMWLNAANPQTVTVASGALSEITDFSGNGRNASQSDPSLRPAYVTGSMNGLQVARFDGTSDVLDLVAFAQQSGQNIMAVVDTTHLQNQTSRIFMNRSGGPNIANAPGLYLAGPTAYAPATFWTGWVGQSAAAAQAPNIFLWSFNLFGSDAISNSAVNGSPVATTNFSSGSAYLANWSSISGAAGSQWSAMDLGELIVYSPNLTFDDYWKTEAYYSAKWGVGLTVSSTNPYKDTVVRADNTAYLGGSRQVAGLVFSGTGTSTTVLGGMSGSPALETLTIGADGIVVNAGVNATTLGAASGGVVNLVVAADQSWMNDSGSLVRAFNGISRVATDTTSRVLSIGGSGSTQLDGAISNGGVSGSLALTKTGAGLLTLTGTSSYTGFTTVSGGRLSVNGSLGSTAVSVLGTAELGGSGSIGGPVSVAAGGTLSPGNSIASLATGTTSFASGATFEYEYDSSNLGALGTAADLLVVNGGLSIASGALVTFADLAGLAAQPFVEDTTIFALINYSGSWNGGLFTYGSTELTDGSRFLVGAQEWEIDYNRTSSAGIDNFTGDYLPSSSFVTITAVPEPSTLVLMGLGVVGAAVLRRRRG